jgi:hypothetical protein
MRSAKGNGNEVNVLNFASNAKTDANVQKRLAFHSSAIEGNRKIPCFIAPKEGRNLIYRDASTARTNLAASCRPPGAEAIPVYYRCFPPIVHLYR